MNIFVAGIHGVGKTYVAGRLPPRYGLVHTSASKLIREERALPAWNVDKRVAEIDTNQIALAAAVARHNREGTRLLLDGHFVLLDGESKFVVLGTDVFRSLNLSFVIVVEASASVIAERLKARDGIDRDLQWLDAFLGTEREVARAVCAELQIPLHTVMSPTDAEFEAAVAAAF